MGKLISADHAKATESRLPNGGLVISIPIQMRMRGKRKEIVLPPDAIPDACERLSESESLVMALVRAHCWNGLLENGRFRSIPELAAAVKLERSYVSRILGLVNLAPDIALAVLNGKEPEGFTLRRLRQGIPVLWEEQRKQFGFPAPN
ncbi:MAG TPA: hypothetical protein PLG27_09690 [Candidatus Latescibacteria bacterium]|nr:hypothetical protein [Candidatus Latescibacterota bacterium]